MASIGRSKNRWTNFSVSQETMDRIRTITSRKGISPHALLKRWLAREDEEGEGTK